MKLDDKMKQRIDNYFDSISPEDLYKELTEVYNLKDVEDTNDETSYTNVTRYCCTQDYSVLDVKEFINHKSSHIQSTHDVNKEDIEGSYNLAA